MPRKTPDAPKPTAPKRGRGRPIKEDRDGIMERVCARIAKGMLVLDAAPLEGTTADHVYGWGMLPQYAQMYAQARVSQAHALAEEAVQLSDQSHGDTSEGVAARRLQVDTRKWFTSKIAKKAYGESIDVTSNGETLEALLSKAPPEPSES
jgi:hypothetical protein